MTSIHEAIFIEKQGLKPLLKLAKNITRRGKSDDGVRLHVEKHRDGYSYFQVDEKGKRAFHPHKRRDSGVETGVWKIIKVREIHRGREKNTISGPSGT